MKKLTLIAGTIIVAFTIIVLLISFNMNLVEIDDNVYKPTTPELASQNDTEYQYVNTFTDDPKSQIVYENIFSMKIGSQESFESTQSNKMHFKTAFKLLEDDLYLGVIYDLQPIATNTDTKLIDSGVQQIGFTLRRTEEGEIIDIDMLGLPINHPFFLAKQLISQLTYYEDGSHKQFTLNDGTYNYIYQAKQPNKTIRILDKVKYHELSKDMVKKHNENWYVIHQKKYWPQQMQFTMEREIDFQGNTLAISQAVLTKQIKVPTLSFWDDKTLFAHNANSIFTLPEQTLHEEQFTIANLKQFNEALKQLDTALNPHLAKAIGLFLLDQLQIEEIFALLLDENTPSEHHAHIIYALQKADTPEAEKYLGKIAENVNVSKLNRTRAIVSSGFFASPSQTSIDNLYNLIDDSEQAISNAATLNLGNIAKTSPELDNQVGDILLEKLKSDSDPYTTILAISNTNNPSYDQYILPFIKDKRFHIRSAAFSIIARRKNYQNLALNSFLAESHPGVIDSITVTMTKFKNLPIPYDFMVKVRQRIVSSIPPILASRILKFYLSLQSQFNDEDRDFLKNLLESSLLGEKERQTIKALLG